MHDFVVHSNESACNKSGHLWLDQVWEGVVKLNSMKHSTVHIAIVYTHDKSNIDGLNMMEWVIYFTSVVFICEVDKNMHIYGHKEILLIL